MESLKLQVKEERNVKVSSKVIFEEKEIFHKKITQKNNEKQEKNFIYSLNTLDKLLSIEPDSKRSTIGNSILNKAKYTECNDEFYTTYESIEKEISHYVKKFKDKIVLCNCDDPFESNFVRFFIKNFNYLGLKALVTSSYNGLRNLSNNKKLFCEKGYFLHILTVPNEINTSSTDEEVLDFLIRENAVQKLEGNGDFRSAECIEFLRQSDIVVTNPPFSLFREFIALVLEHKKHFLVIGNHNALTYKEIFPLIQKNKVWLGYQFGDMSFRVPKDSVPRKSRFWIDERGQKWRSLGNAMWLTNMDMNKRHQRLNLIKFYDENIYHSYDEYNAIEVSNVADIPKDYSGIMGVPITFLNKYNPEQFEIVGEANHGTDNSFDLFKPTINGKLKFKRILIRNKMLDKA